MELVTDPAALVALLASGRAERRRIGLVPTLGALHSGHGSLIAASAARDEIVVVTVFVNPLQFGPNEDFASHPRDLDGDLELAGAAGATHLFAPSREAMFPAGEPVVTVDPGPLGDILEGAARPGHFRGVATIVTKLFALIWPDAAYFGEKDYQQLVLIHKIVDALSFPLEIVDCPTVREPDGLALSSRNRRLTDAERAVAPLLHQALVHGRTLLSSRTEPSVVEAEMAAMVTAEGSFDLDYLVVRDAATLGPPDSTSSALRLLGAARLGTVRLIDNIAGAPGHDLAS